MSPSETLTVIRLQHALLASLQKQIMLVAAAAGQAGNAELEKEIDSCIEQLGKARDILYGKIEGRG